MKWIALLAVTASLVLAGCDKPADGGAKAPAAPSTNAPAK